MIEAGSFTFFGDVAQQIYGSRLSWRDSGIDINKIWRFDVNYRNPATITAFAKAITQIKYWRQDGDMVEAASQIAEGLLCLCARVSFEERNCSSGAEIAQLVEHFTRNEGVVSSSLISGFCFIMSPQVHSRRHILLYDPGVFRVYP